MTIRSNSKLIAGLAAAALSAAMLVATPAQAESRTFAYGTYGSAKYEGFASVQLRQSVNRSVKRNQSGLRAGNSERHQNFTTGNRKRNQIKISK